MLLLFFTPSLLFPVHPGDNILYLILNNVENLELCCTLSLRSRIATPRHLLLGAYGSDIKKKQRLAEEKVYCCDSYISGCVCCHMAGP